MASLLHAERISLGNVAKELGVHRNTIHRWRRVGIRGVKLPFVMVGGTPFILRDDLERFIAALSDDRDPPAIDADEASDRERRANAACSALGV